MNELSILAKYILYSLFNSTNWSDNFSNTKFFEDIIPTGVDLETYPPAMFVNVHSTDFRGAFGYRLYTQGLYQIKAITTGEDYSKLEALSNQIDATFDWQNIIDTDAGRPKSQDYFLDPDDNTKGIRIMSMVRLRPIKFPTYIDGINHLHLGGEYEITYYQENPT